MAEYDAGRRPDIRIGARLRAARKARGMTIEKVSEATGLTKGFISRLERDAVSPSVASLVAVCNVIDLPVGALFEAPDTALVTAEDAPRIHFGGTRVEEFLLTPGRQQRLRVLHSFLEPGADGGQEPYTLDCDVEFVYVVRGELVVVIRDGTFHITAGGALTFPGREPHTWRNGSAGGLTEVLWVLSPAP